MRNYRTNIGQAFSAIAAAAVLAAASISVASPAAGVAGFGDVEAGAFYTQGVQWMVDENITTGVTPECFEPYAALTRGQVATFLWRMEDEPAPVGSNDFVDVNDGDFFETAVQWMVDQNITSGTTATTFEPYLALNRAQFATFLWRLEGEPTPVGSNDFVDVPPGAFFETAVQWMVDENITSGTTPTTFAPGDTVTRGQVATFLWRYNNEPPVTVDATHPTDPPCAGQVPTPPTTSTTTTTTTTDPSAPFLTHEGMITTRPFVNDEFTDVFDGEGMAYVPVNGTLWLADDNGDRLYELEVATGNLLSTIAATDLAVGDLVGDELAIADRTGDLESLAYDSVADVLYAFSGDSGVNTAKATAFRLTRTATTDPFTVESYRPLTDGFDSAATDPADQTMYVVRDTPGTEDLSTYDYETNTLGTPFGLPEVTGRVLGMGFSSDGADLFVLVPLGPTPGSLRNELYRVDWATKTVEVGPESLDEWMAEGRAASIIGDRIYIQDGDDALGTTDPLKYAIHIFGLG